MGKCSEYNQFNVLCQSCDYPDNISCSKKAPIKLSSLPSFQELYIEKDKYSDPEVMTVTDFINSSYFLDEENVKIFIAELENVTLNLYNWIEFLGEDMYEGWIGNVYEDLMANPITKDFLKYAKKILDSYPVYYPGEAVEIDIPVPKGGNFSIDSMRNLCNKCRHNDVFWENSGCNLKHGMEPCNFDPKEK